MKRNLIALLGIALLILVGACATPALEIREVEVTRIVEVLIEPEVVVETVEVEVTRVVDKIVEVPVEVSVECPSVADTLGPWTVQQEISALGQYLVPEEMEPGQWAYQAVDTSETCWVTTYSDLSGSSSSELGNFYSENKGFFVLNDNVRLVELTFGRTCTWRRIGD